MSIIFAIALCVGTYFLLRYLRQHHFEPKYLPGKFLKRKWKAWGPGKASYGQVPNQTSAQDTSYPGAGPAPEMQTTDGVRRDTSIRSIMTLPPYSQSPKPTEQVIAREGERAGMDMVMEYPETAEEQETRREEQMDSMYQIRLQRRQELADREARRRERRDARSRGDSTRLEQLNAGSRLRADSHNSDNHDSDSRPLLQSDAVSSTAQSFERASVDQSGTSLFMTESHNSTELERLTLAPTTTQGSSRPESQTDDGDLGMLNIPPPPDYEHLDWGDAPAYQSPVTEQNEQARQLPPIDRLPSIHVNLPSPMTVSPVTPTEAQFQTININNDGPPTPTEQTPGIRMVSAGSTTTTRGPPPILHDSTTPETSH